MEDDEHSGLQESNRSPKQIRKINDILIKDRCVLAKLIRKCWKKFTQPKPHIRGLFFNVIRNLKI